MKFSTNALLHCGRAFRLLALALCVSLTACGPREPKADITIINGAEPESLDPHIITGQPDARVVLALFEGLTRFSAETADAEPGLAERWEISADGLTYKFFLRSNAVWSTGEPITADDVVFSWRRALNPLTASDYAGQLFYVKNGEEFNAGKAKAEDVGIRVLDARTVQVELVAPTAFFLDLCAFQTLAVVPRKTIEKHGDRWMKASPVTPWNPSVAKVDAVMGALSSTAMRTRILPGVRWSNPIAVTLPTGTPRKRTAACG